MDSAVPTLRAARDGIDPERDAVTLGHVDIELGIALETTDPDAAADNLTEAVEILSRLDLPFDTARAQLALGDIMMARGDRVTARDLWGTARDVLTGLGSPIASEATDRLERIG